MSYAVETKKRKFDRILESLTDHPSPAKSSLNTRNNASSIALVPADDSESIKRPRFGAQAPISPSPVSLASQYLPSDRKAFLDRLETFRQVIKWHVPSTEPIHAAAWAKRGWKCTDTDLVSCGSCNEQVLVQLDSATEDMAPLENDDTEEIGSDDYDMAHEIHAGLVKKFQDLIVEAHTEHCPWRRRGCDSSIQRIEGLLNASNAITSLQSRYNSIWDERNQAPAVVILSVPEQSVASELERFQLDDTEPLDVNSLSLAMCGWHGKGDDIVACGHCFRSLGLWLYRGTTPAMERLDAVDSHLEYCPWRSPEAQDTEITVTGGNKEEEGHPKKDHVPGWLLVYQAITRDNVKKGRTAHTDPTEGADGHVGQEALDEAVTPEQREKRMKELFRRIKDIKKPFNVKGLLRRKEKSKT